MATFLTIVEGGPERLVLERAPLPIRLAEPRPTQRLRVWLFESGRGARAALASMAAKVRQSPLLAPVFLVAGLFILAAAGLFAMACGLLLIVAWMLLHFFGWTLVFAKPPSFRAEPAPRETSPRSVLPLRVECCAPGRLIITDRDGVTEAFDPTGLTVSIHGDQLGLASLSVLPSGGRPFSLVVDGVRGSEAGVDLARRIARALGLLAFAPVRSVDGETTLRFSRAEDPEHASPPYRAPNLESRGILPRFSEPLVPTELGPSAHPTAGWGKARSLVDAPQLFSLGSTLRIRHEHGADAGRVRAASRAVVAAAAMGVLVKVAWVTSGWLGMSASPVPGWVMAGATFLLLAGRWAFSAWSDPPPGRAEAVVDLDAGTVDAQDLGRLEEIRAVLATRAGDEEQPRVEVWIVTERGDSLLWCASAKGREAEAREAAEALATFIATKLGVEWASLAWRA